MKTRNLIVFCLFPLLSSCVVLSNINEIQPVSQFATEGVRIQNRNAMDAEIFFRNGDSVKTKILGVRSFLFGRFEEPSVTQKIKVYNKQGQTKTISYVLIDRMVFKDFDGNTRLFFNRGQGHNSLHELAYGGKIKFWIRYSRHPYDRSVMKTYLFIHENGMEKTTGMFVSLNKILKEITASKPELATKIEASKLKQDDIIEILKEYDNQ
jgi:hypothetical protein